MTNGCGKIIHLVGMRCGDECGYFCDECMQELNTNGRCPKNGSYFYNGRSERDCIIKQALENQRKEEIEFLQSIINYCSGTKAIVGISILDDFSVKIQDRINKLKNGEENE